MDKTGRRKPCNKYNASNPIGYQILGSHKGISSAGHMYSSSMTGSEGHNESHEQLERQNSLADAGTTTEGSNLPQVLGAMTIYHPPQ